MMFQKITSHQNPRFKAAKRLKDRREREKTGLFVIEGYREISRAGRTKIETLFICPSLFLGSNEPDLIKKHETAGVEIIELPKALFEKLSFRDRPDGLFAIARQQPRKLEELELSKNPFLLVAEAIEKPGNLGSILRSCDAAGVDACLVADRCTDIYNPNVVRASVGTLFTVPTYEVPNDKLLAWLKERNIDIVATTPDTNLEYTDADLTGPIALAVGTEQVGLTKEWLDAATIKVRIPMMGTADSLNVAAATTLVLYEALRQRRVTKKA